MGSLSSKQNRDGLIIGLVEQLFSSGNTNSTTILEMGKPRKQRLKTSRTII